MAVGEVRTRRANTKDAEGIARAHVDSIGSIGPHFYSPEIVDAWGTGLTPDIYVQAMEGGEAFFIATGELDGEIAVLGFATHRVDDDQDGASVYVRGRAVRRGIGTALLQLAVEHARAHGATTIHIQASLAGVEVLQGERIRRTGSGRGTVDVWSRHAVRVHAEGFGEDLTVGAHEAEGVTVDRCAPRR